MFHTELTSKVSHRFTRLASSFVLAGTIAASILPSNAKAQSGKGKRFLEPVTVAQNQAPPAGGAVTPGQPTDKLDVSDLENKYWAAKDTDFSVVQNRLFSKAGRFGLSGQYGGFLNESWSEGPTYGGSLNYFFSERYGMELAYTKTDSKDNQATTNLKNNRGGVPDHGKMKQFYGAAFNWVPFYAKMSVLNSSIIYFDMSLSPGIGMVEYEQQTDVGGVMKSTPALTLDVTQHFFLTRWFALRFDYKMRWYQEEIISHKANLAGSHPVLSTDLNQTNLFTFGATFYY